MPGMGNPGMMAGGMGMPPRAGTAQNPVGGGPPGIVSAQEAFGDVGTLPSPDPSLMPRQTASHNEGNGCSSCGAVLRANAKFCTKCGTRT
jgi:ribosomal protein L40E